MLLYEKKLNSQAKRMYIIHKKGEINTTEHFKNLLEVEITVMWFELLPFTYPTRSPPHVAEVKKRTFMTRQKKGEGGF